MPAIVEFQPSPLLRRTSCERALGMVRMYQAPNIQKRGHRQRYTDKWSSRVEIRVW